MEPIMDYKKPVKFGPLYIIGVFVVLGALILGIFWISGTPNEKWDVRSQQFITSSSAPAVKIQTPIDLTGIWESDNPRARFVATVAGGSIDIDLETETGSLAYWSGTFNFPTAITEKIQSTPDPTKLTWSNATSKEFTYLDGTIAFDYSGPGFTSGIVLHKRG